MPGKSGLRVIVVGAGLAGLAGVTLDPTLGVVTVSARDCRLAPAAGVTLAAMNIPQALGYTRIAGTPVVTGIYTLLLPLVAFAAFGSAKSMPASHACGLMSAT